MTRIWVFLVMIFSIVLIDQFTKGAVQANYLLGESTSVIPGFFSITYVKNPGAAFGIGATAGDAIRKPLFLWIPVLACIWLAYLIWQTRNKSLLLGVTYSLILAGAFGNLIDRFMYGYVVDFLDFYFHHSHFPAFNVADSCITVAAGLLIYDFFLQIKRKKMADSEISKDKDSKESPMGSS